MDTLPGHLAELVHLAMELQPTQKEELEKIVLAEALGLKDDSMLSLSRDLRDFGASTLSDMQRYFEMSKKYPQLLVTQNDRKIREAYTAVSRNIWNYRIHDLEEALRCTGAAEQARRDVVTRNPVEMMPVWITDQLNEAFLQKYEELIPRVKNDFQDFFPYRISQTSPKLMIFEKMNQFELISCVMKRF